MTGIINNHKLDGLQTTEMNSLTILDVKNLKSVYLG